MTIEKPPFGSPCNSCGLCCLTSTCPLAAALLRDRGHVDLGPYPFVQIDTDTARSSCGLVAEPMRYVAIHGRLGEGLADAARVLTGSGQGCDGQLESEDVDPAVRSRMRAGSAELVRSGAVAAACAVWGIRPLGAMR